MPLTISTAKEQLQALTSNYAMVPSALISSGNMPAIATYAALEMFASSGESASLSALSRVTGLARPTIRRARDWLVQKQYIVIEELGNGRKSTRYILGDGLYPRGNDPLPQGSLSVTPHVPETRDRNGNSNSNSNSNKKEVSSNSKQVTNTPEWFKPLSTLEGYKNRDYQKSIVAIEQVCSQNGVTPEDVVREFLDYYPIGRASRGWKDPVPALLRTLQVQISKLQGKGKAVDRVSANAMTLEEEIEFQKSTGLRPSSVQADTVRADWLRQHREGK